MTGLRCAEVEARFVDVVDGRLDPADSVRFHAHIEECATCRERAALWRGLVPSLRGAAPPAPAAMATRRMQVEIERRLAGRGDDSPARRWRAWWAPAFGLAVAAAAVVVWLRVGGRTPAPVVGYGALTAVRGEVQLGVRATAPGARVPIGEPIMLSSGAAVELALDSGAALQVQGSGRLALEGSARAVVVHLSEGKLAAQVTHRRPDETFAVTTRDLRVEVRGTQFSVEAGAGGSHVRVSEGRVAVRTLEGRVSLVSAGERFDSVIAPPAPPDDGYQPEGLPIDRPRSCADIARACQGSARAVRAAMRGGDPERALRMIMDARRAAPDDDSSCPGRATACGDELRYLHAEALNQAGRRDDAVAAYRALGRRSAPEAMRQNALYAAAQIERRQGNLAAATADFQRAAAAAPRGALRDEALVGAMESAAAWGDAPAARALAAQYLREYPHGLGAATARRLAGDGRP